MPARRTAAELDEVLLVGPDLTPLVVFDVRRTRSVHPPKVRIGNDETTKKNRGIRKNKRGGETKSGNDNS